MSEDCRIKVPSRPFISVECSCGYLLPGQRTWDEWDQACDAHYGITAVKEVIAARLSAQEPIVIERRPDGSIRTMEWCKKHQTLTEHSIIFNVKGWRQKRCMWCDRERRKTKRMLHSVTS